MTESNALDGSGSFIERKSSKARGPGKRRSMFDSRLPKAQGEVTDDPRTIVVVIGGGFAGTLCCRELRKQFRVILIDAKEYFEYYPGICRAYADPKEHRVLSAHYQTICDNLDVEFTWGEVTKVETKPKRITCKGIAVNEVFVHSFDYLIVATGSQYGIDMIHSKSASLSAECLWYPTFLQETIAKSSWDKLDERFLSGRRKHIETEYKELARLNSEQATILVIGAGFVGIEFATEVKHFFEDLDVVIVESRDKCVGVMPQSCIDYCQAYLDRVGIKTIYNAEYKAFLCPEDKLETISTSSLIDFAKKFDIPEPSRVYMAVGIRPINQFMPECCLTPGKRGGWIQANVKQQVLCGTTPFEGIFAAGNCVQHTDGGPSLPKNAFPGEDMASVACHNIRVMEAQKHPENFGCFGMCIPRKMREVHWNWGIGLCATSLGPNDATLVLGGTPESGSGYTVLTGLLAALNKEFVRYSKIDQIKGGCLGTLVWKMVH